MMWAILLLNFLSLVGEKKLGQLVRAINFFESRDAPTGS